MFFFIRQVLESLPFCAILFLRHGEPPGDLLGSTFIIPLVRLDSLFLAKLSHFILQSSVNDIKEREAEGRWEK